MSPAAHIVAQGVRCAVGLTAESAAAAIRARISRVAEHPFLVDGACEKLHCARDPKVDPKLLGVERMIPLAEGALSQVLDKLSSDAPGLDRARVLLALPEARPGFGPAEATRLEKALLGIRSPSIAVHSVERVGTGHAGVLRALEEAVRGTSEGRWPLCIVGGVDSYLHDDTLDWLESDLRVKRMGTRSGFAPGEAAVMLAVVGEVVRVQQRLSPLARIDSVATTHESADPKSDLGLMGEGLTEAVLRAVRDLRPPEELVTDLYGDINGERERTQDWGFTLMRTSPYFRDGTEYVSAAGECGDVGAATAALACVLATQAWRRGYANGRRALVWAGSWGGLRGAALLAPGGR